MTRAALVLNPFTKNLPLNELAQSMGFKFSPFVCLPNGEIEQTTPWMRCKDFMNEILWAEYEGVEVEKYGLLYSPHDHFSWDKTRILVTFKNDQEMRAFKRGLRIFNAFCKKYHIARTTLRPVKDEKRVFALTGSGFWIKSTVLISLYLLLLRCLCYHATEGCMEDLLANICELSTTDGELLKIIHRTPALLHNLLSRKGVIFRKKYGVVGTSKEFRYKVYSGNKWNYSEYKWNVPEKDKLEVADVHELGGIATFARAIAGKNIHDYKVGHAWLQNYLKLLEEK